MISEPELDSGDPYDATEVLTETPPPGPPGPPRARRPWLWALGGALAASAVWGAGIYAYDQKRDEGPDMLGYKAASDLCDKVELRQLVGILGKLTPEGGGYAEPEARPLEGEKPALETTYCSLTFGPPETGYGGQVTYVRHLVTDPGPEFADQARRYGPVEPYPGVGEQAYFSEYENEGAELRVLDGQVEISISFTVNTVWNEDTDRPVRQTRKIDLSGIDVPLTQDMLALMKALKK